MPEDLDPQIREFIGQLRRLVDRGGLSVAALADRTGYSKTSWERYLNGRLLAPKGAVVALAEVTGVHPVHLTTLWELAERAWSRAEMRHDRTMEAVRVSQARAALGEQLTAFPADATGAKGTGGAEETGGKEDGTAVRGGGRATVPPGVAGPAGVAPTIPPQPTAAEADPVRPPAARGTSWGVAGHRGPSPAGGAGTAVPAPDAPAPDGPTPNVPAPDAPAPNVPAPDDTARASARRRLTTFLAAAAGTAALIAGALLLTRGGGDTGPEGAPAPPSRSAGAHRSLSAGVKCGGADCTGKDAEAMGCSGRHVTTARSVTVGTALVEVRYSRTCGAAWARITGATGGDEVRVAVGRHQETGTVDAGGDTIAYTPMIAVSDPDRARACATLASGQRGCTP
ncbi:DUF2690 domain-containing protein [Streptomyces echinoruber]|uniref:HTH cro/C1-type domain-containing protein n=1 Tax=Streptomyces echinoruber TaxID=68898 RepID=A0A918RPT6_9ACTN|nr:XRE family transcriptional regulator [Streptomyces echinoruber]GHA08200.1 hypothetical protein GCM10010389_54140 [Streptomyces echinoruber]